MAQTNTNDAESPSETRYNADVPRLSDPEEDHPKKKKYCFNTLTKPWLIFIASFFAALAVVLILIFVVGRSVAQKSVDDSKMSISGMHVLKVSPNSMSVKLDVELQNFAPLAANMAKSRLKMSYNGTKFAEFDMPAVTLAAAGTTKLSLNQLLEVSNDKDFSDFTFDLMSNPLTRFQLHGSVDIKAMGISYGGLSMNKLIHIQGLSNFMSPPPKITRQEVVGGSKDELQLKIDACLNNPGVVSFKNLGKLTLDIFYEEKKVGYTVVGSDEEGLELKSGENCWTMDGFIVRSDANKDVITKLVSAVSSTDDLSLTLKGNEESSIYPLLKKSMSRMSTTATFKPLEVMAMKSDDSIDSYSSGTTQFDKQSYGIMPESMLQYANNVPLNNLPYPIQAVFNPTPSKLDYLIKPLGAGATLGGEAIPADPVCAKMGMGKATCVSTIDLSSRAYIDIKALVYNPLATPLKIFKTVLDVKFSDKNKWDCSIPEINMDNPTSNVYSKNAFLNTCLNVTDHCSFNKEGHGSFHMASALQDGKDAPLLVIPPFSKRFLYQRLCLSSLTISWMDGWLNKQVQSVKSPYFMWLQTSGVMDIQIGNFRTDLKSTQDVPIYGYYWKEGGAYPFRPNIFVSNGQTY